MGNKMNRRNAERSKSRFAPSVDGLETRNLLSTTGGVASGVNLVGGTVEIGGVSGINQTTVFNKAPGTIAVIFNGQESDFNASQVSKVAFQDNGSDYNYDCFINLTNVDAAFQGGHYVNVAENFGTGSSTFSDDSTGAYYNVFAGIGGPDNFTSNGYGYTFYENTGQIATGWSPASYSSAT
jgi:hypothetical protein